MRICCFGSGELIDLSQVLWLCTVSTNGSKLSVFGKMGTSHQRSQNCHQNCPKLRTKFNQVSFRSLQEVAMNFIRTYDVARNFLRSWPEVHAKLARSLREVGPKFARSFAAKFTSKCKHIICAYRKYSVPPATQITYLIQSCPLQTSQLHLFFFYLSSSCQSSSS